MNTASRIKSHVSIDAVLVWLVWHSVEWITPEEACAACRRVVSATTAHNLFQYRIIMAEASA